jgi:glycosyltransferase involved in cell wall biosynthesis
MKIGFDGKRYFHNQTGLGNYSRTLLALLHRYFPENEYYLFNPKPKKNKFSIPENVPHCFEINPTKMFDKMYPALWRQNNCVNEIEALGIQIFHGLSGEIPLGLHKTKVKSIVTIHDLIFIRYPELYSFIDRKIHYNKFKHAVENATQVVAITEQTKQDIVTYFGTNPEKIKVIYQGCNAVFKKEFSKSTLETTRLTLGLPEEFVLNVGTIEKRKNIELVVKAIANTTIPLVILGKKTSYYKEILSLVNELQLENQVIFLDNVSLEQLAQLYQLATIFVYPSIFEGFGIPIIEALYSKTPVITSTGSCFPEAGGPNSIYVDSNDVEGMKKALLSLWNNKEKQTQMAERGYQFVQKFNDEVIANEWIRLYTQLV